MRLRALSLAAVVAALCLASSANAIESNKADEKATRGAPKLPALSADDLAKLNDGKEVRHTFRTTVNGSIVAMGESVRDVKAPRDLVWKQITSIERYPKMIDKMKSAEVYGRAGNHIKARFVVVPVPVIGPDVHYSIDHELHESEQCMTWTLDHANGEVNDIKASDGHWCLRDIPERPGYTRLYYKIATNLGDNVPDFLQGWIADEGLSNATNWVKRESEKQSPRG
jgi:hypothetical protein